MIIVNIYSEKRTLKKTYKNMPQNNTFEWVIIYHKPHSLILLTKTTSFLFLFTKLLYHCLLYIVNDFLKKSLTIFKTRTPI